MNFVDRFQVGVSETMTIPVSQAMSDAFITDHDRQIASAKTPHKVLEP